MVNRRLKYLIFSLFILTNIHSYGQEKAYNAFVPDTAVVATPARYVISIASSEVPVIDRIDLDQFQDITYYSIAQDSTADQNPDFTIDNLGLWEDRNKDNIIEGDEFNWNKVIRGDTILFQNYITITPFNVGLYVFNGLTFNLNGEKIKTNETSLFIALKDYQLTVVDSTGFAPIKNIEREGLSVTDFLPYFLAVLIPLIIGFAIYYGLKNRKKSETVIDEEPEIILPPHVFAMNQLNELKEKQLWQKGEIKAYQTELSRIIREYMEGRYGIRALESTTTQIINQLRNKNFDKQNQETLKRILQISDLVKFAKAKPEINIHEEFMNDSIAFVEKTKITDEENETGEEE